LAATIAFTLSVGYLGLLPGALVGSALFLAIVAIPVVLAVRHENSSGDHDS
jgi:hypothetical protein